MKINIYYWNNEVGVVNDARLIKSILNRFDIVCYDISINNEYRKSDLGIFIQNIELTQFENNKKNIFIVNEEWLTSYEISNFKNFDYLIVKSEYAKEILNPYHSKIVNTGFFSLDRCFFPSINKKILHFKGKSIQKNHELIFNYKDKIDIVDSEMTFLSENEVINKLNNYDIHICCSLYEGWGHYLWEAMSCGKLVICSEIPVFKEYLDPDIVKFVPIEKKIESDLSIKFLKESSYPFRRGYYINKQFFEELLNDRESLFEFQSKNSDDIRYHFLETTRKNKTKFMNFINYILS